MAGGGGGGGVEGSLSLPFGARVEGGIGGMEKGMEGERRSQWVDFEFCVGLSLAGLETGKVRGRMRFMFTNAG